MIKLQKNHIRINSRLFAGLLIFVLAISICAQETLVFESGKEGNATYRIPAIIKLKSGKLLAFAEGRKKGAGDFGDVNIVLKTSDDNGKSWSSMQNVAENGDLQAGSPAPVVDYFDKNFPNAGFFFFTTLETTQKHKLEKATVNAKFGIKLRLMKEKPGQTLSIFQSR